MKAIGYIRIEDEDEDAVATDHDRISVYCADEGLELLEIYVDRNTGDEHQERDALTILIDHVGTAEGAIVLVPSFDHLSSAPSTRMAFTTAIEQMGGHVQALVTSPARQ